MNSKELKRLRKLEEENRKLKYMCVNRQIVFGKLCEKIVANLAVLEVTPDGFQLLERAPGVSISEIQDATEGQLTVSVDDL